MSLVLETIYHRIHIQCHITYQVIEPIFENNCTVSYFKYSDIGLKTGWNPIKK